MALVRWGDSISAQVELTPPPRPGDLIAGPQDLVAIPRVTGAGSPRAWILNTSTQAPPDPAFPTWLLRLRGYLGVGSTARQVVWNLPFFSSEFPVDGFQVTFGAVDVRVTAELLLAPFSEPPSVSASIQAWVTCAPFTPYAVTEALP